MDQFSKDIRYGIRTLLRSPGFTFVTVLTLALGIGANTAIFSLISGVLLKPLPYANEDRIVLVQQSAPLAGRASVPVSVKEYYDYKEQAQEFDQLVEYHQMSFDLLKRGEPDRVSTGVVSHNFFDVLGIQPIHGRSFLAEDDAPGAEAVLILSHTYWKSKFDGDPGIVNQVFQMNDRPHRVIGILPNVPLYPNENDVYMSVSACPFRAAAEQQLLQNRRAFSALNVFGRLKPGVSREQAIASVGRICHRFATDNPGAYNATSGFTATVQDIREQLTQNARPMLLLLLGATGLILLIACANVANLTLARVLRRDRELAVREALGADRGRIVRQLLTESSLIAIAGGALGLLFALSTLGLLTRFVGRFTSRTGEIAIDPGVLAFTLFVSLTTGLLFGILPALASRIDLAGAMRQGSKGGGEKGGSRTTRALIVAQVAVSVVLLVGAGLLLASFYRLQKVEAGYDAASVVSAEIFTNFTKYPNVQAQRRFYLPLIERLQSSPGVVSVAITNAVPLSTIQPGAQPFQIEGVAIDNPDRRPTADGRIVSADYFRTLQIPLVRGRAIAESDDDQAAPVVLINNAMTKFWEGRDPVGSRVSLDNGQTWVTVVGVVGDVKQFGLDKDAVAQIYVPLKQTPFGLAGRILVRTQGDPRNGAQAIKDAVRALDDEMPVKRIQTLEEIRTSYLATPKVTAVLLAIFGGLALVVTMAGLGGVIATSVAQRTQEFGLRMALGATRDRVVTMVMSQGLSLVATGLVLGLLGSLAVTGFLSRYLFATSTWDPLALVGVLLTIGVTGVLACLGPAVRATTVDPLTALRSE